MRRVGDFLIACAPLAVTFPLIVFVAAAIKWESPGPIFDRRERIAPDGRRFTLLRFQTTASEPGSALPTWAQTPTRLGHFLRYTRIEALPQLINILRGDIGVTEGDRSSPFWD